MMEARGGRGLLVHEWIEPSGGAEKVLDALHDLAPDAEMFCLWDDAPERFPRATVCESWIGRSPLRGRKAVSLLAMSPVMRRSAPLEGKDWALVSSHSFAHHLGVRDGARQVPTFVYAHTPPRYLWAPEVDPRAAALPVRVLGPYLRRLDREMARSGGSYAVNSRYVAARSRRAWGIEPVVINPPVDVSHVQAVLSSEAEEHHATQLAALPQEFVLGASRFVPYKRHDLVIDLAEELGVPAVLCGSGPEEDAIRQRAASATVPVHVLIRPADEVLYRLMERAIAFPPIEDFGIVPVEALAAGACLLVNDHGGAGEIVSLLGGGTTHDFERGGALAALDRALASPRPTSQAVDAALGVRRFQAEIRDWMSAGGVDLDSATDDRPVG